MNLFGLPFILYFFKLSYGSNFNSINYNVYPNGWTLVTTSFWKNTQKATASGIALLMNQYVGKALNSIESIH